MNARSPEPHDHHHTRLIIGWFLVRIQLVCSPRRALSSWRVGVANGDGRLEGETPFRWLATFFCRILAPRRMRPLLSFVVGARALAATGGLFPQNRRGPCIAKVRSISRFHILKTHP